MEKNFNVQFLKTTFEAEYVTTYSRAVSILDSYIDNSPTCFGIDTETVPLKEFRFYPYAGLSPHLAELSLVQIFDGEKVYVFNLLKLGIAFQKPLVKFLESHKFVAHYAQFDLQFFMKLGVSVMDIGCTRILTRLIYHALYPSDEGLSATLEDVTQALFKERILKKLQISDWGAELTFEQIEYAALDAVCTYMIAEKLSNYLLKFGLERIYRLTKEAQFPIAQMQLNGLRLDTARHKHLSQFWRASLEEARKELVALTKMQKFTPKTIGEWLLNNLPQNTLDIWPRTEKGKLATDAHVFADFSYLPIVKPFSKFQKALKLTTTYGTPLVELINPVTKRLHASYNLCGARTGRLSCSKPNLQQAPRDREFRSCFIPSDKRIFIRADFNQIEIRVAAEVSRDATMLKSYRDGVDIHKVTAAQVSRKRIEDIEDDSPERQMAKAINFGFMFGLGAKKFAHYAKKSYGVDVTEDQAYDAVDAFRSTYAGYRKWQLVQTERSGKTMCVRTPCNKLRKLNTDNCYGASMNTPVQGGAAECMLYSLVILYHSFLRCPKEWGVKLVNCVHDEVLIECVETYVKEVAALVNESMVSGFLQVFPNGITNKLVAVSWGKNWAEAK